MNDEQAERRIREWFVAFPVVDEPASLREFLVALPTTHPRSGRVRAWRERPRVLLVAAAVAAIVAGSALAIVGSRLLETTLTPSVITSLVPTAPSPSSSPSLIGPAIRIGEHVGSSASLAATSGGPLVSMSVAILGAGAGTACEPSAIGSVGGSSVVWSAAPGAILELAGDPGAPAPIGLGVSAECDQPTVAVPDGSGGFVIASAPNPLRPDAAFFARKPGDPSTVAAWDADPINGKGGFVSWSTDGGISWHSETAARPVGWDAGGTFWSIDADGGLARSQGPGFSSTRKGTTFAVATTSDGQAADIASAAVFRDRILVAPSAGGLESAAVTGSTSPDRSLGLQVWDMSVNSRYVAVVGLDAATHHAVLAISTNGQTFTLSQLPSAFAVANGNRVRLLALDERILLTDGGQNGVVGVWSAPLAGLPAAPPAPTPVPTPAIPTPPQAEKTSIWTPVALPSLARSGNFGGPGGGLTALPTGGFIDFVPTALDRSLVFTSTDGSTWVQTGEVTGSDAHGIAGPVGFDGHRYVALGGEGGGQSYGQQSNGAAWVSTDLRHWTKAPVQDAFGGAEFGGIAASADGFVAIGFDQGGQSVWTSRDGLRWSVVTDDRVLPKDSTEPTGILYTAHGYVMVGQIAQEAAAWTSVDGRHWTVTSPLAGGSGVGLVGLADGPAGLISLGSGGGPGVEVAPGDFRQPVAPWISSTGTTWHREPSSPALFGAYATIVGAPGGYVAAGTVGLNPAGALWTSANGVNWVPVAGVDLPGASSIHLVSDGRHVLLSTTDDSGTPVLLVCDGLVR
jgi:hypothetical protein